MDKINDAEPAYPNGYADSAQVPEKAVDRAFEPGIRNADGTFVFTKNPSADELLAIYEMLVKEIGPAVGPFDVVQSVYGYNPISFWGLYHCADERRRSPRLVGFVAYLPLNEAGKAALE